MIDGLHFTMDEYKRDMKEKKVAATNKINVQSDAMERSEIEKAQLMLGNEEKTIRRLDKTNEHGQIVMTIKSLYEKLLNAKEHGQGKDLMMMISAKQDAPRDFNSIVDNEKFAHVYLQAIEEFIKTFHAFLEKMNEQRPE